MHLTTIFIIDKNEAHTEITLRRYLPKERLNIGYKPLFNTRLDYFQAISLIWIKKRPIPNTTNKYGVSPYTGEPST